MYVGWRGRRQRLPHATGADRGGGELKRGAVTSTDRTELDSALSTIEDLIARVASVAERHTADADESVTLDLYEVERALQAASRRLAVVVRRLGG